MSESVKVIVAKQMAVTALVFAVLIAAAAGVGWWLLKRSAASEPARVPLSAVDDCEKAIKGRMQNPGTVKFTMGGVSTQVRDNGGYLVRRTFKASNAFGMESEMRGLCVFPPGGGSPEVMFLQ